MSSDPEAVVRRMVELFNRLPDDDEERQASPIPGELARLFGEEIEFVQPPSQPDGGVFRGRAAFRDAWDEWLTLWQSHRSELADVHVRGNRVLAFSNDHFVARGGMELAWRGSAIYTVKAGLIVGFEAFGEDHDAAWAAFEAG